MSVKRYRDFLDYWDSRFDENEKILNNYPQLANFTFRECKRLWDILHTDYAALLARHNALKEAVAWEREFDEALVWLVQTGRYPRDMAGKYDLANERDTARAEVDRLLEESC